jgi:uncharacterized protein
MRRTAPAIVLLFLFASPAFAASPSFDCAKAKAPDEIAICGDEQLSQLDRLAALAYGEAQNASGKSKARAAARDGLAARKECGSDATCIMAAQVETIRRFQELGASVSLPDWAESGAGPSDGGAAAVGALPTEIGQCVNTTIAEITSRFQADINADPDDGSAVTFENGGGQVSYEKVQEIIDSQVGDPVLMCLVELPQDCPPGDDRGKIYTTTNLRTQESWTLPDSQHSCGGA